MGNTLGLLTHLDFPQHMMSAKLMLLIRERKDLLPVMLVKSCFGEVHFCKSVLPHITAYLSQSRIILHPTAYILN